MNFAAFLHLASQLLTSPCLIWYISPPATAPNSATWPAPCPRTQRPSRPRSPSRRTWDPSWVSMACFPPFSMRRGRLPLPIVLRSPRRGLSGWVGAAVSLISFYLFFLLPPSQMARPAWARKNRAENLLSLLQHIRHSHETSPFNTVRTVRLLLLARDIIVSQC